ncbi:MAG: cell division protein FtsA [Candidatus Babeliales bacterium]
MRSLVGADRHIVAIDVGTTKICVLIAQYVGSELVDIIGIGKAPSEGLAKGVVVDIAKTVQSIKTAVREAELMSGISIESAYVGIAGSHIHAYNSHGVVPIKRGEITDADIANVIDSAKAIALPEGQQILHVLPQFFIIDGTDKIQTPRGMHGIRLEAQVHVITGSVASVQNLIKCCELAGVKVADVVLEQLASAEAVLSDDERQLGVGMLDIGGGTSDFALYNNGAIKHTYVLPVAGNRITADVAVCLKTTLADAERIKKEYGHAAVSQIVEDSGVTIQRVEGVNTQQVQLSHIMRIIEPRVRELLTLVHDNLVENQVAGMMPTGLVITGGGSMLRGIDQLAQEIFNLPVRCASPRTSRELSTLIDHPMYATGYGLLRFALKKMDTNNGQMSSGFSGRIMSRMKSWVADFF